MNGAVHIKRERLGGWICSTCLQKKVKHQRTRFLTTDARLLPRREQDAPSQRERHLSTSQKVEAYARTRRSSPPNTPARTRFAPSPTGYLHIGGLRTALFSYLLAKRTGGQFLLRIEDTDQKRLVPDAESRLCEDLQWAGLIWDEGPGIGGKYGPYRQSERNPIYQKHARRLLDDGSAYRCFCTPQSTDSSPSSFVTSGCYQNCSSLSAEEAQDRAVDRKEPCTVRLHPPADASKRLYPDLVYGNIKRLRRSPAAPPQASEDDAGMDASDTILVKSDGTPTYHLANVVDDHLMKITHVIRGTEWMASTPLHYDIYSAFGWKPPEFAHVGLLVDEDKAKLSKRNQDLALDVGSMRDEGGVVPDALNNFLALLGWSNPTKNDVMDMDTLIQNFDLKFTRGNAMVRMGKLSYLQKHHVAQRCRQAREQKSLKPIESIVDRIADEVRRTIPDSLINDDLFSEVYFSDVHSSPDLLAAYCTEILLADSETYWNAKQFVERNRYFLAFDTAWVPAEQKYYDKDATLSGDILGRVSRLLLQTFNDRRVVHEQRVGARIEAAEGEEAQDVEEERTQTLAKMEQLWHTTLNEFIWKAAVADSDNVRFPFDDLRETIPSVYETRYDRNANPFASRPEEVEANARALVASFPTSATESNNEEVAQDLERRFLTFRSALSKYLREKLTGGLPGPSMSATMALLGLRECCRRLGVDPHHEHVEAETTQAG